MTHTFTDHLVETRKNGRQLVADLPCANIPMESVDEVFHPISPKRNIDHAKALCGACPVKTECSMWAWENKESGVWGGCNFVKGKPVREAPPARIRKTGSRKSV